MRRASAALLACACVGTGTNLAAEDSSMLRMEIPNLSRMWTRVQASVYADIYASNAMAPMRAQVDQMLEGMRMEAQMEMGLDPMSLLDTAEFFGLDLVNIDSENEANNRFLVQAHLPGLVGAVLDKLKAEEGAKAIAALPTGADAGFSMPEDDGMQANVYSYGDKLLLSGNGANPALLTSAGGEADLWLQWDGAKLYNAVKDEMSFELGEEDFVMLDAFLGGKFPSGSYSSQVIPSGTLEEYKLDTYTNLGQPVDLAALNSLPDTTLLTLAFGIDAKGWYEAEGKELATAIAAKEGMTLEQMEGTMSAALSMQGMPFDFQTALEGISGTYVVAITPSAPFPAATVMVPRSPVSDFFMMMGATVLGAELPEQGAAAFVQIPDVPIPVQIAKGEKYWLATSDTTMGEAWLGGSTGGFDTSPAGSAALEVSAGKGWLVYAADTSALLDQVQGYLPMVAGMMGPDGQMLNQMAVELIPTIKAKAKPDYLVIQNVDGGTNAQYRNMMSNMAMMFGAVAVTAL
jgi:hypothetical protein